DRRLPPWMQRPGQDENTGNTGMMPGAPWAPWARRDARPGSEHPNGNRPLDITSTNWTNLYPDLNDVSAVSSSDAWAVGEYGHLVHYTNGSWTALDPANMRGSYLFDIDMVSPGSGWMVGQDIYTYQSKAFQYDGTSWTERSNGLNGFSTFLGPISAVSANNV